MTVAPGMPFSEKPFRLITQEDIEMVIAAKRAKAIQTYTKGKKAWTRIVGGDIAANRLRD